MTDRFVAVARLRYGVQRDCIKDTLTGALAVFVEPGTERRVSYLNADHSLAGIYTWAKELASQVVGSSYE